MRKRFLSILVLVSLVLSLIPVLTLPSTVLATDYYEAFHVTGSEQKGPDGTGWVTVDLDSYFGGLGSDTSGVIVHVYNSATTTYTEFGLRKKGSTDGLGIGITGYAHFWSAIGVDTNKQFEIYIPNNNVDWYIVGYTTWDSVNSHGAYFFTNRKDYSPTAGSWVTKDASSDAPGAIGLIFTRENTSTTVYSSGIKPYGSSYTTLYDNTRQCQYGAIVGCSEAQLVSIYVENTAIKYYLVGYVTEGAIFDTNPVTLSTTTSWQNMAAFPAGSTMAFIQIGTTDVTDNYGFRRDGDALAIYDDMRQDAFVMVGLASQIAESYVGDAANPVARRWGYAVPTDITPPPPTPPTVETDAATDVDTTSATLNGDLTSLGDYTPVDCYFEYGKTVSYELGATSPPESKGTTGTYSKGLSGLDTGTKYYYRAVVDYGDGYAYGSQADFTTLIPGAPTVATLAATDITASLATLNGNITSMGGEGTVYVFFQYGETVALGSSTSEQTKNSTGIYNDTISVEPFTQYYFRAALRYGVANYTYGDTLDFTSGADTSVCFHNVLPEEQLDLTTPGGWQDIDLDDYIADLPADVTGVILKIWNFSGSAGCEYMLRKNGSTDWRGGPSTRITHTSNTYASIGVDEGNIFEIWVETTSTAVAKFYISGYTTSGVTYFTNVIKLSAATLDSWTTISLASYVPVGTLGVILSIHNTAETFPGSTAPGGLRMIGSTDDFKVGVSRHNSFLGVVGVDENKSFQYYKGESTVDFYLTAYVTSGAVFLVDKVNITPSELGGWPDLAALPEDATAGFVEIFTGDLISAGKGVRQKGSVLDITNYGRYHDWGIVGADEYGIIQGHKGSASVKIYLVGYAVSTGESDVPPEVTTLAPSGITSDAASLRADITSLGTYTPVVGAFEWGLTASFGNTTSNVSRSSTGIYSIPISSLTEDTLYYFRAKVTYDSNVVYGQTLTFTTLAIGDPSVTTEDAVSIGMVEATLQGTLDDLGDYATVYVSFEYGKTTSFGSSTTEQTRVAIGSFSGDITGLSYGTLYYFRAKARGAGGSIVNGATESFTTLVAPVNAPSLFKIATRTATSLTLTWTKGTGTINTMVRYDTNGYPTSPSSGTAVYFGSGSTVTHSDLTEGTTYYYSAWGEVSSSFSSAYAVTAGEPSEAGISIPDLMLIESVEVFDGYLGGQLYVISYKLIYEETPLLSAQDFFRTEIEEGGILRATGAVTGWQYRPAAIYLAGDGELTWGESYIIELAGLPNKWSTPPSTSYELTSSSWRGSDLTELDSWVISLALRMQSYYNIELTIWIAGYGTVLNDQGGQIFRDAIPGLADVRPGLFSSGISEIEVDTTPQTRDYEEQIENNFGEEALAKFTALGSFIGLGGTAAAGLVFFIILILIVGGLTAATGSGIVASVIAMPLVAAGGFLGVVPLALIGVAGALLVIFLMANLWLARS